MVASLMVVFAVLAGSPSTPGAPIVKDSVRVTLLGAAELPPDMLKGAAGGRKFVWLVEPREGEGPPGLGEVRLLVDGALYNKVTNATSSKPLAPDVAIHDFPKFNAEEPTWAKSLTVKPRAGALVFVVLIRGGALRPDARGKAGLELGLLPRDQEPSPGARFKLRWFESPMPQLGK